MRVLKFLAGVQLGVVVGASAVFLTTPRRGDEMQEALKAKLNELMDVGRQASDARRAELEARMNNLRAGLET